jgi:hypothetical protein
MKRLILFVGLLISLGACATGPSPVVPPKLPFPAWYISFVAPKHMEVWVESADVLDQRGFGYFNVHGGVAGYTGKVEGWPERGGGGKPINNVDLPDRIYLRWQSLVEPQAYTIGIQIPQWVRDEMVKPHTVYCRWDRKVVTLYRETISLGMAPGGIVKVWVGTGCLEHLEVGRFQAKVHPLGPFQNRKGLYYRDPTPEAQAWIEKNGIPYGSW